jgi:hypothetical protein
VRARLVVLVLTLAAPLAATLPAAAQVTQPQQPPPPPPDPNPCHGALSPYLRCPDLVMRRPFGLYAVRDHSGRLLLHAANAIVNVGTGPAELHGRRVSSHRMRASQHIHTGGGRILHYRTGARLYFKFAHAHRRWWKFGNAARFELWKIDAAGHRTSLARVGPKHSYCLRDLRHLRPRLRRSPRRRHFPACSSNPLQRTRVLGTSVGWADVYPADYPQQYIDVSGLRGCFAYTHFADPLNGIWETRETNNRSSTVVRLPPSRHPAICPGQSRPRPIRTGGEYHY